MVINALDEFVLVLLLHVNYFNVTHDIVFTQEVVQFSLCLFLGKLSKIDSSDVSVILIDLLAFRDVNELID